MPTSTNAILVWLNDEYPGAAVTVTSVAGTTTFALPQNGLSLDDLGAFFEQCLHEPAFGALLPDIFKGSGIVLTGMELGPAARIALTLQWKATWNLVPGLLAIATPVVAIISVGDVAGATISGLLTVAQLEIEASVAVPHLAIAGRLKPDSVPTLSGLLDLLRVDGAGNLGEVTVKDLIFTADIRAGLHGFSITLGNWKPLGELEVRSLRLNLMYVGGPAGYVDGLMTGEVVLSGTTIVLSAQHLGPNEGWQFEGSVKVTGTAETIATLVAGLGAWFHLEKLEEVLPALSLSDLTLGLSFNTHTKDCTVTFTGTLDSIRGAVSINLHLLHNTAGGYDKHVDGTLSLSAQDGADPLQFELIFDQQKKTSAFAAVYRNPGGGAFSLGSLCAALSTGEDPLGGSDPKFKVKDVLLAYETGGKYLFALAMDAGIDLSGLGNLPLIGKLLPSDQSLRIAFQPVLASSPLPSVLPAGGPPLPKDLTGGFSFSSTLRLGDLTTTIDFGGGNVKPANVGALDTGMGSSQAPPSAAPAPDPAAGVAAAPASGVTWVDLQRHFGPLHVQRLGLAFHDGKIDALLDAALGAGPLEIGLSGLGAEYDLGTHALAFRLDGLAIDFKNGPVEIGAAFLRIQDDFAGKAILRTETLALDALGAYGEHQGQPSLFIYAFVDYPIGGPSFFFVEGLAVGFGFNRRLIVPPVGEIYRFPLVAEVINPQPKPAPASIADGVRAELETLERYVPAAIGEYFLAAGIKFSTFKLIDSFALLVLSVGPHVEVDLLGVSTLVVPTPDTGQTVDPLAEVQMAFSARFDPLEGFLGLQAQLTPNSFVLSRQCHLRGGYAMYAWLLGEHAGDFVYSAGGYHPAFRVPSHYPRVPRLGFNWQVSGNLSVKGDLYYALTPTAAMAGGTLSANWESTWDGNDLQAWFELGLNLLMSWKPYSYQADAYVEIGASVTIHFFGTHTVTIHAGADLEIWGPEFAGTAHVHVKVMHVSVGFTVDFGGSRSEPAPLTWEQFKKSFLPESKKTCTVTLREGLVRTDPRGWIVNPKELRISVETAIPLTHSLQPISRNGAAVDAEKTSSFGIAPMNRSSVDSSQFTIQITASNGSEEFAFRPIIKPAPAALWGVHLDPHAQLNSPMIPSLAGYEIRPATPVKPGETVPIKRGNLSYEIAPRNLEPEETATAYVDYYAPHGTLAQSLSDVRTNARRASLLEALGIDPVTAVDLSADLPDCFVPKPAVVAAVA